MARLNFRMLTASAVRKLLTILALGLTATFAPITSAFADAYTARALVDVGWPEFFTWAYNGPYSVSPPYVFGINASGQIAAGGAYTPSGEVHAIVTGANGVGVTDLGTLTGGNSWASGINASGQVVGYYSQASGCCHAFTTGPNGVGLRDLGGLGGRSWASSINVSGQVAGYSDTSNGFVHAFITGANGIGMSDLGTLAGFEESQALGINASGQVAGNAVTFRSGGEASQAFITGANGVGMRSIGSLHSGGNSYATGINDRGQVAGSATWGSSFHAFVTGENGRRMRDLGTLGGDFSGAAGINSSGQVVGTSTTSTGDSSAFITGANGIDMIDLNALVSLQNGATLTWGMAINDAGQVFVGGSDGVLYLLTPVPEPGTVALMIAGLGLTAATARRRRASNRAAV